MQVQFMYGLTSPPPFFPHLESKFFSAISINKEQKQSSGSSLCGAKDCNEEKVFWEMLTKFSNSNQHPKPCSKMQILVRGSSV